jgi:hypothetical protein
LASNAIKGSTKPLRASNPFCCLNVEKSEALGCQRAVEIGESSRAAANCSPHSIVPIPPKAHHVHLIRTPAVTPKKIMKQISDSPVQDEVTVAFEAGSSGLEEMTGDRSLIPGDGDGSNSDSTQLISDPNLRQDTELSSASDPTSTASEIPGGIEVAAHPSVLPARSEPQPLAVLVPGRRARPLHTRSTTQSRTPASPGTCTPLQVVTANSTQLTQEETTAWQA